MLGKTLIQVQNKPLFKSLILYWDCLLLFSPCCAILGGFCWLVSHKAHRSKVWHFLLGSAFTYLQGCPCVPRMCTLCLFSQLTWSTICSETSRKHSLSSPVSSDSCLVVAKLLHTAFCWLSWLKRESNWAVKANKDVQKWKYFIPSQWEALHSILNLFESLVYEFGWIHTSQYFK